MKCAECSGKIEKKSVDFTLHGMSLGMFPAEVCTQCGEVVFDEKTAKIIDACAKKKRVWGLEKKTMLINN